MKRESRVNRRLAGMLSFVLLGLGSVYGQGRVAFGNGPVGPVNAPFYDITGTNRIGNAGFRAALFVGEMFTQVKDFRQVGTPRSFQSGFPGYWSPVTNTLPPFAPGTTAYRAQVRVWDSRGGTLTSFAVAEAAGASIGISDVLTIPLPASLAGAAGIPVTYLSGLRSVGVMATFTVTRGQPQTWPDRMPVPSGSQLFTMCNANVGTNRWYRAYLVSSGEAVFTTTNSTLETVLSVYEGSVVDPNALRLVNCTAESQPGQTATEVRFQGISNLLYLIAVGGKNRAFGSYQLNYGLSTSLDILKLPDRRVEVSWPADATSFVLESKNALSAGTWSMVTNQPTTNADRKIVQLRTTNAPRTYFRLRQP